MKYRLVDFDEIMLEQLQSKRFQKAYLNTSMEEFIKDGDLQALFRALELVIRARDSVAGFCRKAGIDRAMLYQVFKGERVPRVDTLQKILKTLGVSLKVA